MQIAKHVFILGIDGAGNAPKDVSTPALNRVFSQGVHTFEASAAVPTISAECWGAILHGVGPEKHLLTNDIVSRQPYPPHSLYPSLFRLVRERHPDAVMGCFSAWAPINAGIVEQDLGVTFESLHDEKLALAAAEYILTQKPTVFFLQLDDCDGAGHTHGYFTAGHLRAVQEADRNLGVVLDAIARAGIWEESLIMVTADHGGGGANPKSHGSGEYRDAAVFWGCCGPCVPKGAALSTAVSIADTAAMAVYALGMEIPRNWDGKVPPEILRYAEDRA